MQQHLEMVEFGVAGLEDVRTLVKRWKAVLAELARQEAPSMVWQTYRQVGGGSGGPAGRGRRCGLTFLAPKERARRGSWPTSGTRGWKSLKTPSSPGCSSPAG